MKSLSYKSLIIIIITYFTPIITNGQKISNIQKASIFATDNLKPNSNPANWGDNFQAYNNGSRIWYTIANDENNLYLYVSAKGLYTNEKIFRGGLVFTVRVPGTKTGKPLKDDISITFPVINNKADLIATLQSAELYRKLRNDTIKNIKSIDSLQTALNTMAPKLIKEIKVSGISTIIYMD